MIFHAAECQKLNQLITVNQSTPNQSETKLWDAEDTEAKLKIVRWVKKKKNATPVHLNKMCHFFLSLIKDTV